MPIEIASPRATLLQGLRLMEQVGAGPDGTSFRAIREEDGAELELRVFSGLPLDPRPRDLLLQRLNRTRLLEHPAATRVLDFDLEAAPPVAVLEWADRRPLAEYLREAVVDDTRTRFALQTARDVASAVAAAHRLGLTHNRLGPETVWVSAEGRAQIDFTGTDTLSGRMPSRATESADDGQPKVVPGPRGRPPIASGQSSIAEAAVMAARDPAETLWLDGPWNPEEDVAAVSSLVLWLLSPKQSDQSTRAGNSKATLLSALPERSGGLVETLCELVDRGLSPDVSSRPSAADIARCLDALVSAMPDSERVDSVEVAGTVERMLRDVLDGTQETLPPGQMLGRFKIRKKLGEGGMGAVYEAEDVASCETVAVKVLSPIYARQSQALRRFKREAAVLAEIRHPNVVNLLEVNEDNGVHFLAMEYVAGQDLRQFLANAPEIHESLALRITIDVLRGLAVAHERGIVHRDVKPANILLIGDQVSESREESGQASDIALAKLSDFGLARHAERVESLQLTQTGMLLGTPQYMAPEQCAGEKEATPAADVYAVGATLFHMLAGRPPFVATDVLELVDLHRFERPPALSTLRRDVSEAAVRIVEKALAKDPVARYRDASQMLADVQGLLRGAPSTIQVHPVLSEHDPQRLFCADFEYDLAASPEELWPYVSNTERINRAVGVPAVEYTSVRDEHGTLHKYGDFRMAGLHIAWEELPFEWIEGQRLGVLREFSKGPFHWFLSIVETLPRAGGGTRLKHSVRIAPRGIMGRLVAHLEVNVKGRPKLKQVYHRIDDVVSGKRGSPSATDPFEAPRGLGHAAKRRLDERLHRVQREAASTTAKDRSTTSEWPQVVERLGEFLAEAAPQALARIRPFEVARQWGADREVVLDVCLRGASEGLLELHWDLLCPTCRISAGVKDTLREIERHAYCEVCDLDFELDFGNSIELIFRAHPEIRDVDLKTYCIGGPEHSPHVIAQVRLMAGERCELPLRLAPGTYLLRGPQLPYSAPLDVHALRGVRQAEVELGARAPEMPALQAGGQMLAVSNSFDHPMLVRVERTIPRGDVVTAAQVATRPLFRALFPDEALDPQELLTVSRLAFLAIDIANAADLLTRLEDAAAYSVLSRYRRAVHRVVEQHEGVLVHASTGALLHAAFDQSLHAVRAALALSSAVREELGDESLILRAGVHCGAALVVTTDDQLDYFGRTVDRVLRLPQAARPGELVLTAEVGTDVEVAGFLQDQGISIGVRSLPGEPLAQCVALV